MHRSIARDAQPMADDGSFTARNDVGPAEPPPGDNWGVYVYAGAGSTSESEARYRGTVTAMARFNIVEVALKDPWIEPSADGGSVLTALVSHRHDVGAEIMHRVELGTLGAENAAGEQPGHSISYRQWSR